jgi:type IV pilus assembly protein PilF
MTMTRARHRHAPIVALFSLLLACGHSGPAAQSPERQAEAEYDLARDYFYKGEPRAALDHALKAVDLDDSNSKALYFTSSLYLSFCAGNEGLTASDCKLAKAEQYARKAISQDDAFRDAKNLLGNVLILENKYKDAIEVLSPLVKDPSYTASYLAWGNLGWAQVLDGSIDQGIASLKNAVTQPKFCVGYYRLGMAYDKKGDLAQAEQSFTQAVQTESPDCQALQDAWQARGEVRLKQNKKDDACQDLGRCREISEQTASGKACIQSMQKAGCAQAAHG